MSPHQDPELFDVLQDAELMELAELLRSAPRIEAPLDDAFRSALRRQLMQKAWDMGEGRPSLWRRLTAPQGLAWASAAVGVVLIASVVVYATLQPRSDYSQIIVDSPMADKSAVRLAQPILVHFNQPMDHSTTEAAVQITPATTVAFTWQENTLSVQPTSGNLAPNTQYHVTVGPGAQTQAGQKLVEPKVITFVTQPAQPAPPSPVPTAAPTPGSLLTGERQLANLGGARTTQVQWSGDSATVYFVAANGALDAVPSKGGELKVLVPDGTSSLAVAPAGDRLAYIRGGRIEVLALAAGTTIELQSNKPATMVAWAQGKLVWATSDGVYTEGATAPTQLVAFASGSAPNVISISPDGSHAVEQRDQAMVVLDLATGTSTPLGPSGAQFAGWSPDGTRILYTTADSTVIADVQGATQSTLRPGEPSWSSLDGVLIGSDTELYQVRPDGFGLTKLANGTYHQPQWAPDGAAFVFFRGGAVWSAGAPPPAHEPTLLEQAGTVVDSFMKARLAAVQPDQAKAYLDDAGKQAYSGAGPSLIISGDDLRFSRYYVLSQEMTATNPDTAVFVVRLVLTQGKRDVTSFEEMLTLLRDPGTKQFLIDQAHAGAHRQLGVGAEVVGVDLSSSTIRITFDSDLVPATVTEGVIILDAKGKVLEGNSTYANRNVTISGLQLQPGSQYKLVVLTTVKDVSGRNVASEYDLSLFGPAAAGSGTDIQPGPSPTPSPRQTPSPAVSPTPNTTPAG